MHTIQQLFPQIGSFLLCMALLFTAPSGQQLFAQDQTEALQNRCALSLTGGTPELQELTIKLLPTLFEIVRLDTGSGTQKNRAKPSAAELEKMQTDAAEQHCQMFIAIFLENGNHRLTKPIGTTTVGNANVFGTDGVLVQIIEFSQKEMVYTSRFSASVWTHDLQVDTKWKEIGKCQKSLQWNSQLRWITKVTGKGSSADEQNEAAETNARTVAESMVINQLAGYVTELFVRPAGLPLIVKGKGTCDILNLSPFTLTQLSLQLTSNNSGEEKLIPCTIKDNQIAPGARGKVTFDPAPITRVAKCQCILPSSLRVHGSPSQQTTKSNNVEIPVPARPSTRGTGSVNPRTQNNQNPRQTEQTPSTSPADSQVAHLQPKAQQTEQTQQTRERASSQGSSYSIMTCSRCGNPVSASSQPGQSCPYCGVRWSGVTSNH